MVSLEENTLWDARVLHTGLQNVDGVILEVVVEGALAEAVVFCCIFHDWLLEVAREVQHLAVMLEPLGGNAGYRVINLLWSLGSH